MASWVTHLMIADAILERFPSLDKRGFCVGNIAPDCNIENEDWTAFTPSREVTHWMRSERKQAADCDAFCEEYILKRKGSIHSAEEYAFLLGYYAHLITDAAFQAMIRDEKRVKAAWARIKSADKWKNTACMDETWDAVKQLISKEDRMREIHAIEAAYLRTHPQSGYLTEILPLKDFPDYIDYLPHGCIIRKISVMGYIPHKTLSPERYFALSPDEYASYVENTTHLVANQLINHRLL